MKKVFIGGSRCINWLGAEVTQRIDRMVAANKPVVVYAPARKDFSTVRSHSDLAALLSLCAPNVRRRINEYILEYAGEVA